MPCCFLISSSGLFPFITMFTIRLEHPTLHFLPWYYTAEDGHLMKWHSFRASPLLVSCLPAIDDDPIFDFTCCMEAAKLRYCLSSHPTPSKTGATGFSIQSMRTASLLQLCPQNKPGLDKCYAVTMLGHWKRHEIHWNIPSYHGVRSKEAAWLFPFILIGRNHILGFAQSTGTIL